MPVSKSAKKALRTAERRHTENIIRKNTYKKAIKTVKKAVSDGVSDVVDLMAQAQSALDKAAKVNTIHKNKAARLKSRLAKKVATTGSEEAPKAVKKTTPKKTTAKKTTVKKTTKK